MTNTIQVYMNVEDINFVFLKKTLNEFTQRPRSELQKYNPNLLAYQFILIRNTKIKYKSIN